MNKHSPVCTLCGSKMKDLNIYNLIKCTECGLVFQNSIHSPTDISQFYETEYSIFYNDREVGKHRLQLYEKFLNKITETKRNGRLLDIGCGYGDFLKLSHNRGWEVEGIEPSKEALNHIKNNLSFNVHSYLEKDIFSADYFDVVTLWNVLDHLPDPKKVLLEIMRILKPGGLLFIKIPNYYFQITAFKIAAMIDKFFLKDKSIKERVSVFHLFSFNPQTITRILSLAGFHNIKVRNSLLSKGDTYSAFTFLGNRTISFFKMFLYLLCESIYYCSFKRLLLGPSIEIFCYKTIEVPSGITQ